MQEKKFLNKPKWVEFVDQIILTLGFIGFLFFFIPLVCIRIWEPTIYLTDDPALVRRLKSAFVEFKKSDEHTKTFIHIHGKDDK